MSEIKNGGLEMDKTKAFEQQQFGPAGIEGVNFDIVFSVATLSNLFSLVFNFHQFWSPVADLLQ